MPTYVYRCETGHQYEKRESFSAPTQQDCDECGTLARRVPVAAPLIFKGSGWYKTDSRNGANSSTGSSSTSTEKSGESPSGDGASADKPAAADSKPAPADTAGASSGQSHGHGHSHGPGTHTH